MIVKQTFCALGAAVFLMPGFGRIRPSEKVTAVITAMPPLKLPPTSILYNHLDGCVPYPAIACNKQMVIITSIKYNYCTIMFPMYLYVYAQGKINDKTSGRVLDITLTEESWPAPGYNAIEGN